MQAFGQQARLGAAIMLALGTAGGLAAPALAADDNEQPVSYSNDQADRGHDSFIAYCADCHGEDLNGGLNGGPPLRGGEFNDTFAEGAPASALFAFMSTQMPPDSPGRFSADTYADLMAYVLRVNGYQPGAPLPSDEDALDNLVMEK